MVTVADLELASVLKFYPLCSILCSRKELLSDYHTIMLFIQVCMKKSLHIADNFIKIVLLECIYKWYQSKPLSRVHNISRLLPLCIHTMTVILEYFDRYYNFS